MAGGLYLGFGRWDGESDDPPASASYPQNYRLFNRYYALLLASNRPLCTRN